MNKTFYEVSSLQLNYYSNNPPLSLRPAEYKTIVFHIETAHPTQER